MYCSNCSKQISNKAMSCPTCGHPSFINGLKGVKSKVAFVLLAVFLGGFGIHRMYINDWFLGVVYLMFCWTGLPMIIALFEAIVIGLRSNDPRFDI